MNGNDDCGGGINNLGVVGNRRDLFKMNGIGGSKNNTLANLPKKPSSLASVARMYEQGNFLGPIRN